MKKIDFMLTAFRDGFQSVFGARVFSSDFLSVVEEAAAAVLPAGPPPTTMTSQPEDSGICFEISCLSIISLSIIRCLNYMSDFSQKQ